MAGKHHDLVNQTKKYKGDLHAFYLNMTMWRKFKSRYKMDWERVKFAPSSQKSIPEERGIYAFVLELAASKLPQHGYILYVGITGDESDANLSKRYSQYMQNLKKENGRPAVFYMMSNWKSDLYFHFIPFPNQSVDLHKMEKAFINSVWPPVNIRDFEAEITAIRAAAF